MARAAEPGGIAEQAIAESNKMNSRISLAITIAVGLASVSCMATTHVVNSSTCAAAPAPGREYKLLNDIRVQPVSEHAFKLAMKKLTNGPVIELDSVTYSQLAGDSPVLAEGIHAYLARAGLMAPSGLSLGQFATQAHLASFSAYDGGEPEYIQVVSLITSDNPQQPMTIR